MSKRIHDEAVAVARMEIHDKTWMTECLALLSQYNPAQLKVLDLGCGNGETADLLKDKFNCQVTCLDYTTAHLDRARSKGHDIINCDIDDETAHEAVRNQYKGHFDVIVCLEVIEHIFNPDTVLSLAHALLKPGGLLIVSTPNMAYISYRIYSLFRGNTPAGAGHHVSFFDAKRLWQQIFLNGFEMEQIRHFSAGEFYLDRAIGRSQPFLKRLFIRALFWLGLHLGPKSLHHSGLICSSKKINIPPIGLDNAFRSTAYGQLSNADKHRVIQRLTPYLGNRAFDEHPDLCQFIQDETTQFSSSQT